MSLAGRVAVVTGAAGGIGRAICLRLAKDGAAISVWDLNEAGAQETASLVEREGGRATACKCNVSSRADIAHALDLTHERLGPVTILVNNAAAWSFTPFGEISDENWERVVDVNMGGTFRCTQMILPDMLEEKWGRIISISSLSAQTGAPSMVHYAASKGGIMGFTKALAMELAVTGITVNNIPPSFIDTPSLREQPVDFDSVSAVSPMKRPGQPNDIAAACAYLASVEAGYVTGQTLSVNGGRYLV